MATAKLTFSQLMEFFSQGSRTTMIGFMGPLLLKKTYKTLFVVRLHFLFFSILNILKNDKILDIKVL